MALMLAFSISGSGWPAGFWKLSMSSVHATAVYMPIARISRSCSFICRAR